MRWGMFTENGGRRCPRCGVFGLVPSGELHRGNVALHYRVLSCSCGGGILITEGGVMRGYISETGTFVRIPSGCLFVYGEREERA